MLTIEVFLCIYVPLACFLLIAYGVHLQKFQVNHAISRSAALALILIASGVMLCAGCVKLADWIPWQSFSADSGRDEHYKRVKNQYFEAAYHRGETERAQRLIRSLERAYAPKKWTGTKTQGPRIVGSARFLPHADPSLANPPTGSKWEP